MSAGNPERTSSGELRVAALVKRRAEVQERHGRMMTRDEEAAFDAGWWAASRSLVNYVYGNDLPLFDNYTRKDRIRLARTLALLRAIPEWAAVRGEEDAC